jgi:hypothetical protein
MRPRGLDGEIEGGVKFGGESSVLEKKKEWGSEEEEERPVRMYGRKGASWRPSIHESRKSHWCPRFHYGKAWSTCTVRASNMATPFVRIWAEFTMGWSKFNWKAKVVCTDDMWTLVPHWSSRLTYSNSYSGNLGGSQHESTQGHEDCYGHTHVRITILRVRTVWLVSCDDLQSRCDELCFPYRLILLHI